MFYKIHTNQAPSYLTSLLPPLSSRSGYTFRKLSYRFPTVSKTSTLNSFLPRAVALWNALPTNVQQASSISHPQSFFVFFFVLLFLIFFFISFFIPFSSFSACYAHTSHLQERSPTSIGLLFLQSCLNICL